MGQIVQYGFASSSSIGGFSSGLTSESGRATLGSGGWFSWMSNESPMTRILTTSPSLFFF